MHAAKIDFEKRKLELDIYFDFLSKLNNDKKTLSYEEKGVVINEKIESELEKILKANGFLLIYNLVESFCRNSLWEILLAIKIENLTLKQLSNEAQSLWIKSKVKTYKDHSNNQKLESHILGIAREVIDNTLIDFQENSEFLDLSGNIDKKRIRELAKIYGFAHDLTDAVEKAGNDLVEIKIARNNLAHGRVTFAEKGKDVSIPQMVQYKKNAITYLEGILTNIEDHIKGLKFKSTGR